MKLFSKWLSSKKAEINWPETDTNKIISEIQKNESESEIKLGNRIYQFQFREFELRLDRDITEMYRLVAYIGTEKRYSFTIKCKHKAYDDLKICFEEAFDFLKGERKLVDLPDNERLKGHYFA